MKKNFYFITAIILFLLNSNFVNALQTNFDNLEVQGYNNNGSSLTSPNIFNCSNGTCGMEITTNANSYGGAWVIQSPIPIINNHNYSLSLRIRSSNAPTTVSTKPNIALGNSIANAKYNYEVSLFHTDLLAGHSAGNSTLQYVFKAKATATHLTIPFTSTYTTTASFMIDDIVIEDLGTESLTQNEINNITNQQTTIIQDSLSQTEENINNNFNNTMNSIFGGCESSNILTSYQVFNGYIDDSTLTWHSNANGKFIYFTAKPNTKYTIIKNIESQQFAVASGTEPPKNNGTVTQFVDGTNKQEISITTQNSDDYLYIYVYWEGVTTPTLENVLKNLIVIEGSSDTCKNKIDDLNDNQKETNEKLDNLNDNITNSDSSGASDSAGDFFSNFNTDTFGLTSVITAPLELIKSITSKTCSSLNLNIPFINKQMNLPCLGAKPFLKKVENLILVCRNRIKIKILITIKNINNIFFLSVGGCLYRSHPYRLRF